MNYKTRLNVRVYLGVLYCVIAVLIISFCATSVLDSEFFSSFGTVLLIIGVVKIIKTRRILKNSEAFRQMEILENDERNIMIYQKSLALASSITISAGGIAVIVLQVMNMKVASLAVAYTILGYMVIYLICRFFYQKKY